MTRNRCYIYTDISGFQGRGMEWNFAVKKLNRYLHVTFFYLDGLNHKFQTTTAMNNPKNSIYLQCSCCEICIEFLLWYTCILILQVKIKQAQNSQFKAAWIIQDYTIPKSKCLVLFFLYYEMPNKVMHHFAFMNIWRLNCYFNSLPIPLSIMFGLQEMHQQISTIWKVLCYTC